MSGRTIGVTLPVPDPIRRRLDVVREQFGSDPAEMSAHVTVLPPVDVDDDVLPAVRAHLEAVAAQTHPFPVVLAGAASFRPVSPVVFVVVERGADELTGLEGRVRSGVLGVDSRFPFHPHVTIAHGVDDAALDHAQRALADYHAEFLADRLEIHECRDGRWHLERSFPFAQLRGVPT